MDKEVEEFLEKHKVELSENPKVALYISACAILDAAIGALKALGMTREEVQIAVNLIYNTVDDSAILASIQKKTIGPPPYIM